MRTSDEKPMDEPSTASAAAEKSTGREILALARPERSEIATRRQSAVARPVSRRAVLRTDVVSAPSDMRPSLVTRRQEWLRRRRRKRLLIGIALILALFPPIWAVYLLGWLIWRSRPPQKSMRHVRSAVHALDKNRTGIALQQLQEAHLLDPTNNDALYWLGLVLSGQHRHIEAAEALSLVAERVPGLPEVESALVDAYVATNEPESAVYHAQRLLDVAPYESNSLLKLSEAFEAAGRPDLAIQTLEQAPLHKTTLTKALLEIHYRLGTLLERQGDTARALHHFNRVYARDITFKDVQARLKELEAGQDH